MTYRAVTFQIFIPRLRCGSVVSIVEIGKSSLYAITYFAIHTYKIYLHVSRKGLISTVETLCILFQKRQTKQFTTNLPISFILG